MKSSRTSGKRLTGHNPTPEPASSEPRVIVIIPARGGSKGVPGKNVALVGGVPLVARAAQAAALARLVDAVYVSTDDEEIAVAARSANATIIHRPAALSGDTASSESAVLHGLEVLRLGGVVPEVVVLLQATSPFIDAAALDRAVERVLSGSDDVVFSAFETYAFLWSAGGTGAEGVNHDLRVRPRRQDRAAHFQETGAFYVMNTAGFLERRHRFFGTVGIEEVAENNALEIDTVEQLELANAIAGLSAAKQAARGRLDVDALVMDFDGVHTDDRVHVDEHGKETVVVSRADGMGIEMLRRIGLPMLILSKERNPVVAARAAKLQIPLQQGIDDKGAALEHWARRAGIHLSRVAYVGNDVNDAVCLRMVGSPIVVPEAHPDVVKLASLVLTKPGGQGALRELAEMILAAREETENR